MAKEDNRLLLGGGKLGSSILDPAAFLLFYAIGVIGLLASLYVVRVIWRDRK
jgi:hypothetical protein